MIVGPTVITGGGRGIGVAIARRVAADGGPVSLWGRDKQGLDNAAASLDAPGGIHTVSVDVTDEDSIVDAARETAAALGPIRNVVNNAGVANPGPFAEITTEEIDTLFAVNTRGVLMVTKHTLPMMTALGGGSYVNIVSEVGLLNQAGNVAYGASKAAIVSFSKGLAIELAPQNIRVNIVAPGPVETDMWDAAVAKRAERDGQAPEDFRRMVLDGIPTGRFTKPDEVAEAVAFLLDEGRSSAVLGTHLMVTAGSTVC